MTTHNLKPHLSLGGSVAFCVTGTLGARNTKRGVMQRLEIDKLLKSI